MNKIVLITGAGKGLGRSIAYEFASHGYDVIITYLNSQNEAQDACNFIMSHYNVSAKCYKLDVCNEEDIKSLFMNIDSLDCLVNNAAYNNDCDIFDHEKDEFMKVLDTNLVGPFMMCKYAYKLLCINKGSIVNIASTNGIDSMYPESIDYDASKAGLINLTKNLSASFAPIVRVNAIAPGWIETENTEDMSLEFRGEELSKIALNRFANPEEIAKVVYFVGSSDASYMTGSIIRVDGGENNGYR